MWEGWVTVYAVGRVLGVSIFVWAGGVARWLVWWQIKTAAVLSSDNSVVYFGSRDKIMYVVHATSGQILWNFTTGNQVSGV